MEPKIECPECGGTGYTTCSYCNGTGDDPETDGESGCTECVFGEVECEFCEGKGAL